MNYFVTLNNMGKFGVILPGEIIMLIEDYCYEETKNYGPVEILGVTRNHYIQNWYKTEESPEGKISKKPFRYDRKKPVMIHTTISQKRRGRRKPVIYKTVKTKEYYLHKGMPIIDFNKTVTHKTFTIINDVQRNKGDRLREYRLKNKRVRRKLTFQ